MQNCFLLLGAACHYIKLETTEIKNAKTLTAFLKKGESIENEKILLNISEIKVSFPELKGYLAKNFSKRLPVWLVFIIII